MSSKTLLLVILFSSSASPLLCQTCADIRKHFSCEQLSSLSRFCAADGLDCCTLESDLVTELVTSLEVLVNESRTREALAAIIGSFETRMREKFEDSRIRSETRGLSLHLTSIMREEISRLFDLLFLIEYETQKKKRFSPDFASCLSAVWREYSLFGSKPETTSLRIRRALDSHVLMLRSLALIEETLSSLKLTVGTRKCASGQSVAHCRCSLCLWEWTGRVDPMWQMFVASVQQLLSKRDMDLNGIPVLLDQALDLLRTKKTAEKVRLSCGRPKRYLRSVDPSPTTRTMTTASDPSSDHLSQYLRRMSSELSETRLIFENFGKNFCKQYKDSDCWDGIRGTAVFDDNETTVARIVSDKLRRMTQTIESYVTPRDSQTDELYLRDGSGGRDDDEDYDSSSGSGDHKQDNSDIDSTADGHNTDLVFTDVRRADRNNPWPQQPDGGLCAAADRLLLSFFLSFLVMRFWCH